MKIWTKLKIEKNEWKIWKFEKFPVYLRMSLYTFRGRLITAPRGVNKVIINKGTSPYFIRLRHMITSPIYVTWIMSSDCITLLRCHLITSPD